MGAVYAYTPTLLLTCHALYSMGYDNRIQNGPHNCRGPAKAHGSKVKPTSWVSAIKSKHSEGRSNTKGGQQLVHTGPHRGDPMFSSFVSESQLGDFLHAPSCGLACSRLSFPNRDYPGKSLETTWPEFPRGRGSICSCLVLWRGTCPCWLSPSHGVPGSTQILTWHYGAKS
jgi:hypothetical protein